eukprot:Plantae.Rhodophyta-Rhodochaete_pulchella.ctg57313.p2 GENE.Plantae.Rhodophyta-Rhodochaete_pulchella.ctg57313~~Plantae.Rhodophyta-Rhodochaete_pulchella.ctg57313.p2  ORF type:complete len:103 (+),score=7.91 Plantae.Rhodophyta-Rhodochaete_pulchella.ctg57313:754-1062(+)
MYALSIICSSLHGREVVRQCQKALPEDAIFLVPMSEMEHLCMPVHRTSWFDCRFQKGLEKVSDAGPAGRLTNALPAPDLCLVNRYRQRLLLQPPARPRDGVA